MSDCAFNQDSLISEFEISGDFLDATLLCQELCEVEDQCSYFKFSKGGNVCGLYHFYDVLYCRKLAGPAEPPYPQCLPGMIEFNFIKLEPKIVPFT